MHAVRSIKPARDISLYALLRAACMADPKDRLIAPMGEHDYSTLFGRIPVALAVLRVALEVEPDPVRVFAWYRHTRIAELGQLTAEQLVLMGRVEAVIGFLHSIRDGERDG